jgi:hypothetical protein
MNSVYPSPGIVNFFVLMQDQGTGEGLSLLLSLRRPGGEA